VECRSAYPETTPPGQGPHAGSGEAVGTLRAFEERSAGMNRPGTLGELRSSGWVSRPVKEEVRTNAIRRISAAEIEAAVVDQIRGLLSEYGIVIPQSIAHIAEQVPDIIEDGSNELPGLFRQPVQRLMDHLKVLYR